MINKCDITISILRNRIAFELEERETSDWQAAVDSAIEKAGYIADVKLGYEKDHHACKVHVKVEGVWFWPKGKFDLTPVWYDPYLESRLNDLEYDSDNVEEFDREFVKASILAAAREALQVADKALEA